MSSSSPTSTNPSPTTRPDRTTTPRTGQPIQTAPDHLVRSGFLFSIRKRRGRNAITPKGWHAIARGETPGYEPAHHPALKGRHDRCVAFMPPRWGGFVLRNTIPRACRCAFFHKAPPLRQAPPYDKVSFIAPATRTGNLPRDELFLPDGLSFFSTRISFLQDVLERESCHFFTFFLLANRQTVVDSTLDAAPTGASASVLS